MFKQSGIEVCPSEQEIRTELEELAPIIEGTELALDYAAKPLSVQRSVCNAAGLSARRTLGTANRAAEQTTKIFRSGYYRVLPPQPTLRTEKDIGSKSPRNHNGFWVFLCHFSKCNSKDIVSPKRPLDRT